jgi:hypothetical protein
MEAMYTPISTDLVPGLLCRLPFFVLCHVKKKQVIREMQYRINSDKNAVVPIRCDPIARYLYGKTDRAEQLCRMWDGWIEYQGARHGLSQIKHRFSIPGEQQVEMADSLFMRMMASMVLRHRNTFYGTWAEVSVSGSRGLAPIESFVMTAKKGPKRTTSPLYQ